MQIGPYEVVEELGRGGSGAVYRARSPGGFEVAVKVLSAGREAREDQRRRFAREARALQGVSHPHVVRLHEVGDERGAPYLVLDYHPAGSLQRILSRSGPLDLDVAEELGLQLASALEAVHERGVVHRDLKPGNVLVTDRGDALLTDFGLVKDLGRLEATAALTRTGTVLGTPGYASPEQAAGVQGDVRSDVYGWGATMYAALTGRPPIEGGSLVEVLIATKEREPEAIRRRRADVTPAHEAVVMRCLAKDPEARWASVAELRAAWAEAVEAGAAAAEPRRARWGLVAAGAALIAVAGVSVWRASLAADGEPAVAAASTAEATGTLKPVPVSTAPTAPTAPTAAPVSERARDVERELGAAFEAQNWAEVVRLASVALRRGQDSRLQYRRAQALWALAQRAEALEDMWALVRRRPRNVRYRLTLAQMLDRLRDPTSGTRQRWAAWQIDPRQLNRAEVDALLRGLSQAGQGSRALQVIEAAARAAPGRWDLRLLRGGTLWSLGRRKAAAAELAAIASGAKGREAGQAAKALSELNAVQLESLRRRILDGDTKLRGLLKRGSEELARGRPKLARSAFEAMLRIRRAPIALRSAARCALDAGQWKQAIALAEEALRFSIRARAQASACWLIALCFMRDARLADALKFLNRALDLAPEHLGARVLRAQIAFSAGFTEEAFDDAREVLNRSPINPTGLALRGWEHSYASRFSKALADLEASLRQSAAAPDVRSLASEGRGVALAGLGRLDEAERSLSALLTGSPRRPRALFARSVVRLKRGDLRGATRDQQAGVELLPVTHPERPAAVRALARLKRLSGN